MAQTQPAAEAAYGGAQLPQCGDDSAAKRTVKRRSESSLGPVISLASSSSSGTGGPPLDRLMVQASEQARVDLPADAPDADILQRALEILSAHHARTADDTGANRVMPHSGPREPRGQRATGAREPDVPNVSARWPSTLPVWMAAPLHSDIIGHDYQSSKVSES